MRIRPAKRSDRDEILSFCVNTFSWGDYVDRVWDYWYRSGRLLVVEDGCRKIAMSHVAVCPDNKSMWLEGVRVDPNYRRSRVASKLIARMIQYGRQKGALQASAIVNTTNFASQRMMEKNGFEIVSRWAYFGAGNRPKKKKSAARLAIADELNGIWDYLQNSEIFSLSARMYVRSWHWYALDKNVLCNFIKEKSVIVTGSPIGGVAIINRSGYWDRANIMQIVYLDSSSARALGHLISYATNLYLDRGFEELQIVCNDSKRLTSFIEKSVTKDHEKFLLYNKVFTTRAAPSR